MNVLVAVFPGLDHALSHQSVAVFAERRRALRQSLSFAPRSGLLVDGAWALLDDPGDALDAALRAIGQGHAAALHPAEAGHLEDPPMGVGMLWAARAARSVRSGELVVPSVWSGLDALPAGVARLAAPSVLCALLGPAALIRDYRETV